MLLQICMALARHCARANGSHWLLTVVVDSGLLHPTASGNIYSYNQQNRYRCTAAAMDTITIYSHCVAFLDSRLFPLVVDSGLPHPAASETSYSYKRQNRFRYTAAEYIIVLAFNNRLSIDLILACGLPHPAVFETSYSYRRQHSRRHTSAAILVSTVWPLQDLCCSWSFPLVVDSGLLHPAASEISYSYKRQNRYR